MSLIHRIEKIANKSRDSAILKAWKTQATLPLHFRTTFIPLCETKFSVQIVVCPPPHLVLSRGGERAPQNITEKIFITCKKETVLSGITFSFLFAVVNISMGSPVSPYYYNEPGSSLSVPHFLSPTKK